MTQPLGRLDHLTFKGNLDAARHGWLRLTPAYSVHLVASLLEKHGRTGPMVLDPFCGTGTTALVCAERGIRCDTTDINPFLLWLAAAKSYPYSAGDVAAFRKKAKTIAQAIRRANGGTSWSPPLHQIEKWWPSQTLSALARAMGVIRRARDADPSPAVDLLAITFCRTMIDHANVSFGHQSMSFKKTQSGVLALPFREEEQVAQTWERRASAVADAAGSPIRTQPRAQECDARDLRTKLDADRYRCVITSPPYPNRMSYIRELRPYMYWLGYLRDGRQAGELDWQAIGGTWGSATSNLSRWKPETSRVVPHAGFGEITERIGAKSGTLSRYVTKYFHDMIGHAESLFAVVAPGGSIHYIVGNSKFYDVLLPVERIFASMFEAAGFAGIEVEAIRKRSSKKELFEYVVSARKP